MNEPIAIIGSACRLPGGASSSSKLWELLRNPRDVLSNFPSDRLNLSRFYSSDGEYHGSTDVQNKSYLLSEDPRFFDAPFFNINPLEADGLDPQQRLLLETVYETIESAGVTLEAVQGSQTSVFVGSMTADYADIQMRDTETMPRYAVTGTARSLLSNRISYFFDLRGESMTIDTACSSSLVALHQAVQSLRAGNSSTAIVAGVNLILDPTMFIGESNLHMLSYNARSRMWDKSASGYARGEGVGAIYLKPLSQAVKDGDYVECVVRETLINSDGRTKGITMPSASAQADLIRQTYRKAGLDPSIDRPQYFECHGTGTSAGDPQEAQAIQEAFFPTHSATDKTVLLLGSIKTVIGHTEGCAGLAGVLKASLAMKQGEIPPNMHFNELNPAIAPYYDHLQVVTSLMPWPELVDGPLRASINSFGFGGTNAHAILESYSTDIVRASQQNPCKPPALNSRFVGPLTFSAKTNSSLLALVRDFTTFIKSHPAMDLSDLSWMLGTKRTSHPIKTFFSGATRQRLLDFMHKEIETAVAGGEPFGIQAHPGNFNETPGTLGIFTGQGAQWVGMAKELILGCRLFRESVDSCENSLATLPDAPEWSLTRELLSERGNSRIAEAALSQPLCTAIQIAMIDVVKAAGIKLDAVVGHSSGEIAAAYAAGIISSHDAIRIAYYRGYHAKFAQGDQGQPGAMMAVGLTFDSAIAFCAESRFSGRISVAASNAPAIVTLSGDRDAIHEAKGVFDAEKTFARLLEVDTAYHSHHMLACSAPYLESLKACGITVYPPKSDCIWISSVRGDVDLLDSEEDHFQTLKGQYWVDNMVSPVLFSQAVECSLWNGGPFDMVVELGPHPALKGPAVQTIKSATGTSPPYAGVMRRGDDSVEAFSGAVGYIWSHMRSAMVNFEGYWKAFEEPDSPEPKILKDLPSYPWNHQKLHWRESRISKNFRLRDDHPHELLGRRVPDDSDDAMRWRNVLRLNELPWLRGHEFQRQVLFPGAGYVTMALEAATRVLAKDRPFRLVEIQDLSLLRALVVPEGSVGVETVFSIRTIEHEGAKLDVTEIVEAEFSCHACSDESNGSLEKRCDGRLVIHLGQPSMNELPPKSSTRSIGTPVDMDRFFSSLADIGLNYHSLFRGLKSAKRRLGQAFGSASWPETELGQQYLLHPAFLDSAFHAVFAAFSSPASDTLRTPYLPVKIRRLAVSPAVKYYGQSEDIGFEVEAFITESSSTSISGDVHLYSRQGSSGVQVEGLVMKSFSEPRASDDRMLFAETRWYTDTLSGFAGVLEEQQPPAEEFDLVDAIERTALYYFQEALGAFNSDEVAQLEWHHQRMFETVNVMLASIRQGEHPVVRKSWLEDSRETILSMKSKFPIQIDLEIMNAIGQNLVSVLRGDTQLLEVMLQNDMLSRFYIEGRGFQYLNTCVARVVEQIVFKHPHARILEIGAGTGGTARSILDRVGDAYSRYTFTDISSGFFEKAAEKLANNQSKLTFRVLDIEKDVGEQGFEDGSYDIVVASNVLHATRKLGETVQHARTLLRPGGYLILVEVTGDLLRLPFLMGGLPGWWLGVDEGRRLGPGISLVKWDELLQATGFSGVENVVHDMPDPVRHSCSMIVSQAVDEKFEVLRDPLLLMEKVPLEENVLIVGGKTLPVVRKIRDIEKRLYSWKDRITVVGSVDDLNERHLAPRPSVICITELDKPLFADPVTPERIASLQELFSQSANILWVTTGRLSENPLSNMTSGIGRALTTELPHVNLQFLDVSSTVALDPRDIAEAFLRMVLAASPEYLDYDALWTTEPEVVAVDSGATLIPRVMPDKTRNDRLNAKRRPIVHRVDTDDQSSVELVSCGGTYTLRLRPRISSECFTTIQVEYSTRLPFMEERPLFLCVGKIDGSEQSVYAMSYEHLSSIDIPSKDFLVFPSQTNRTNRAASLTAVASHLIAGALLSFALEGGTTLVYEPEEVLAQAMMRHTQWKGRKLIFASTKREGELPKGWISIHPQSSKRIVERSLPNDISCVLDCSNDDHDKVKLYLSQLYPVHSLEPSGLKSKISVSTLARAVEEETSDECLVDQPFSLKKVIPVQDTVRSLLSCSSSSSPSAYGTYPDVIDWSNSKGLEVAVEPLDASALLNPTKTYFLIGLTGEMGQSLCQWMVKNGARYIALGSRNANLDPPWLKEMQALGATIRVYQMDVSDRHAVRSAHDAIIDTMPPIVGVCNAAMVLSDRLFVDMTADTLNQVLRPKVEGTKYLDELFSQPSLDFFITFSSLASVIGNGGQSNYHAANLFMASLAAQRRSRGLSASVIHIGMVADVGYVARTGRSIEDHLRKLFYMPLSESDIHQLFAEAMLASPPNSNMNFDIIMGVEPFTNSANAKIRPPWFSNPRFSHFVRHGNDRSTEQQQQSQSSSSSSTHIRYQLETARSEEAASTMLQAAFSSKLENMMQLTPGSVNVQVSLLDLGCDSLLAVEIRTWFLKEVHVDVPVLKVLSGETVAEICCEAARKYLSLKAADSLPTSTNGVSLPADVALEQDHSKEPSGMLPHGALFEDNGSSQSSESGGPELSSPGTSLPASPSGLAQDGTGLDLDMLRPLDLAHFTRIEKMSFAQSRIWFLRKYLKDRTAYNITVSYKIEGQLQVPRLKRALDRVVSHHDSLRTCFFASRDSGELMQGVMTTPSYLWNHLHSADEVDLEREFEKLRYAEWSLEQGRTFGTTLVSRSSTSHTIIFGYHHIVMDGVSWSLFLRDLDNAYRMRPLKARSKQYSDFAAHQIHLAGSGGFNDQIHFWEREHPPLLADPLPLLPFARVKRRYDADNYDEHTTRKVIGSDLVAGIKRATQTLRVTSFHFHLAVIQVLLAKLLDVEDLCIGITDANRADEDFSDTVGFFLNLLPLHFQVNRQSPFSDIAKQTSEKVRAALSNSRVPFDLILERLNVPRSSSHSPLFQVAVNYRIGDMMQAPLGEEIQLELDAHLDAKSPYDIVFNITQQNPNRICLLEITCRDSLYDSRTSSQLMDMYTRLLNSLAKDTLLRIQECSLYDASEAERAIHLGRGRRVDFGWPNTLTERFDAIQQQHQDDIAVKDSIRQSTYVQLGRHVHGIATMITNRGFAIGSRMAVLCQPSIDSIACMLAILQTGCVYVPLDLSLPPSRHAAIVADSQPSLILCHQSTLDSASRLAHPRTNISNISEISSLNDIKVENRAVPGSPAFLLYTSGSTGVPKGILLSHAGFINYLASKTAKLDLGPEIVLQQSSSGFDMSIAQVFIALANGGTLIIAPQGARGDPVEIAKIMLEEKITLTIATPSEYLTLLRYGNESLQQPLTWRNACLGGETVTEQLKREFNRLESSKVTLTDCYGPTEISACTTLESVSLEADEEYNHSAYSSVGKAIPNTSIYIIDEESNLVPIGFPGEICIGGIGVALGYSGRPELNQTKFLSDPFVTAEDVANGWSRMYRTGDQGRLVEDGSLIFMGRKDDSTQVKLRGLRIELEEVSNALIHNSGGVLSDAVVSVRGEPEFLVAHVVFAQGKSFDKAEINRLGQNLPLPQYMHPAIIITLEHLPINPNGKVDRKAVGMLPLPTPKLDLNSGPQKPLTLLEGQLKIIWKDVLQTALTLDLNPSSDFFMAGGSSLLLVKVQAAIKDSLSVAISLRDLYQCSTLGSMAARISAEKAQQPQQELIDWEAETAVPNSTCIDAQHSCDKMQIRKSGREILLTGATSFLGDAVLSSLLEDCTVRKIHCVAISADGEKQLPRSDQIQAYPGSLLNPTLGLSKAECLKLEASIDLVLHTGAAGHCLNNYSSLRVPNLHSTHFLASLASSRGIPLHYLSSNRVTLLSGSNTLTPVSVAPYPPAGDGSEGFTASKWASECFLENFARQSGLEVCVHRTCAVIGTSAPSEDALNALLRYSIEMKAVPRFENFEGFFDFNDVKAVAAELTRDVLSAHPRREAGGRSSSIRFRHYSGGIKTPVSNFKLRMEQTYGGRFAEIEMKEWIQRARELGIEDLVVSYLEAVVSRGETISFPYMGEVDV
ncbi:MAG: hypothetical protein LQ351_006238 [Letrouitia transgressa]|nr:MAG: hypothetical protein LQ351_006238 [Letrouitia transgressa]